MQSSPYLPSSMPNQEVTSDQVRIASVIIAREEDLEGALVRRKAGGLPY
jgi:DNA polymerase delta subunit 3